MKSRIETTGAPTPAHTFSQGVRKGPILQVSGQGPMDPETNRYIALGDVRGQTVRTLDNVRAILDAAGSSFADVIMLRVYLTTRDDFAAMNEAYGSYMDQHLGGAVLPSRTTVFTGLPHEEMLVEIDALAVVD